LSFTLSNLGDFDGALRATKRRSSSIPITSPRNSPSPSICNTSKARSGSRRNFRRRDAETLARTFNFDQRLLDNIFQELAPAAAAEPARQASRGRPSRSPSRADYVSKG